MSSSNSNGRNTAAGAFPSIAAVFLLGLVGGVVLNFLLPLLLAESVWIRVAGLIPLAFGMWLFALSRRAFRRHSTPLMPWKSTSELVEDGPYRYSRNPIYLAFALMYLGTSFILDSVYLLIFLAIVLILFDRFQIPREERYLETKFGEKYTRYKAKVRRWI